MAKLPRQGRRCKGRSRSTREPCNNFAMNGQMVCRLHGGSTPKAKEKALVRLEVEKIVSRGEWKLEGHETADPGETLLLLISAWRTRARELANAIQDLVDKAEGNLEKALTSETWMEYDGKVVKTGEHAKGLVEQEFRVATQLAVWCAVAIKANLEERRVVVAERNAAEFSVMLRRLMGDAMLQLTPTQCDEFPKAIARAVEHGAA